MPGGLEDGGRKSNLVAVLADFPPPAEGQTPDGVGESAVEMEKKARAAAEAKTRADASAPAAPNAALRAVTSAAAATTGALKSGMKSMATFIFGKKKTYEEYWASLPMRELRAAARARKSSPPICRPEPIPLPSPSVTSQPLSPSNGQSGCRCTRLPSRFCP